MNLSLFFTEIGWWIDGRDGGCVLRVSESNGLMLMLMLVTCARGEDDLSMSKSAYATTNRQREWLHPWATGVASGAVGTGGDWR